MRRGVQVSVAGVSASAAWGRHQRVGWRLHIMSFAEQCSFLGAAVGW